MVLTEHVLLLSLVFCHSPGFLPPRSHRVVRPVQVNPVDVDTSQQRLQPSSPEPLKPFVEQQKLLKPDFVNIVISKLMQHERIDC